MLEARITKLKKETEQFSQNIQPQSGQYEGQLFYDKTNKKMKVWNSKEWEEIKEEQSIPDVSIKSPYGAGVKPDSEYSTTSIVSFNVVSDILFNTTEIKNKITTKDGGFEIPEDGYYGIQLYYFMEKGGSISRTEPTYYTTLRIRRKTKTQDSVLVEHRGNINPYSRGGWYRYTAWMYHFGQYNKGDVIYLQVVPDKQTRISMYYGNFTLIRQF